MSELSVSSSWVTRVVAAWALILVAAVVAACTSSDPAAPSGSGGASTVPPSGPGSTDASAPVGPSASSPASSDTRPPVPTTVVPPPSSGNLTSTVPTRPVRTAAPVPLRSPARFSARVIARLSDVHRFRAQARLPGEVAGPALSATLTIVNSSRARLDTGDVLVDAADAGRRPFVPLESSSKPMRSTIAPGASASGTYVFRLPDGFTDPVTVSASYSTDAPVLRFVGTA